MGLFDGLIGNASEVNFEKLQEEVNDLLIPNETIKNAYKNIIHFSVETAGTFDLDAELKIWVSGSSLPIQKNFNKATNIYKVQSVLAQYVLGSN